MNTLKIQSISVLLIYSIFSFFVTSVVAFVLSYILIANMEEKIINAHSDYYQSFVEAIPHNYSEILSEFHLIEADDSHEEEDHHEAGDHEGEDVWEHFETDLLQTPSVKQFRIFDHDLKELWRFSSVKSEYFQVMETMVHSVDRHTISFHVMETDPVYVIHYYFPIVFDGKSIGVVEITDADSNLKALLDSSIELIVRTLILGGLVLYLSLFALFYRAYRNQKLTLSRLDKSQSLTIHTMSLLAELRDNNTGSHIIRTSRYCKAIAEALRRDSEYSKYISYRYIEDMERSAPLHDIGKVGIPDNILNKRGKLTVEEFDIVKKHPQYGADVLQNAVKSLDFQSFFEIGYQIVLHHHENWDGSGYPAGLKGEDIPLSARIMALADVYDALRTKRPYKEPFSHEKALEIIKSESGRKFDPRLVIVFLSLSSELQSISEI